jgi:hypothetical protein
MTLSLRPALIAAAIAVVASTMPVAHASAANLQWGGWGTNSSGFTGIDGYLWQTATSSTTGLHAVWMNICGSPCAGTNPQWVQTGTYQGIFAGGSSPNAPHVYMENAEPCGGYQAYDYGAPASADYAYYLTYNGSSQQVVTPCGQLTEYIWAYRKGSWTNPPFAYGLMTTASGPASAKTEMQNGAPEGIDYFGCSTSGCNNAGYGLHLQVSGSFALWTSSYPASASQGNPPYLHTYNTYWSYWTCPTSSC